MVLSLNTPVGSNFLKDWPDQNTENCDAIDDFAGPCLTSHPIGTYTPALTASTTNPGLGTGGTLIGKYYKIFDQIWTWGEFRFGSGASVGSGVYRISLPFRAKTLLQSGTSFSSPVPVGGGLVYQASTDAGRQPVVSMLGAPDYLVFCVRAGVTSSRFVTGVGPITWSGGSPGDGMFWQARYQREP